ncbi:nucleoprotein N [Coastal Plains virus]|uniref:Nucleoprotein n=1 Tax=Coastal Plains virus TaxID=764599 RepID=D8V079_9RHAB|nr:nucleoprotein N [Coastal Plains virus]ADG86356.1 nucleoprotein N [Coastal Plains virus]
MYCLLNDKPIELSVPSENAEAQYCSDFFEKNNKKKPTLRIPKLPINLNDLRSLIKGGLKANDLKIQHVLCYLATMYQQIKGELRDDWESFGIHIGSKEDTISIVDLCEIEMYDDKLIDGVKSNDASASDDQWMTFACLAIYRLARTQNVQHRATVLTRINNQLIALNPNAIKLTDNSALYSSWLSNLNYTKLVAIADMFFVKFKDHELSVYRFGTIPSRWKDCGALTSLSHLRTLTGLSLDEIVSWVFVPSIGRELVKMMRPGQELDKQDSYVPYLMDLGLSQKSPYSSATNGGLYTWVHLIGSIMHSQRSLNARMINENELPNIRISAMLTAYVKFNKGSLTRVFVKQEEKDLYRDSSPEDEGSDYLDFTQKPEGDSPDDWFSWLEMNKFSLDDHIKEAIAKECRKIQNTRSGTIGAYVQNTMS